jgi:sugar-specific transcriptional regulator TrmB
MLNKLMEIGLPKEQAEIYLALLADGPAAIAEISRRTGLHRVNIYKAIPSLVSAGLLQESRKGKRKLFVASDPAVLSNITEQRTRTLQEILPELESMSATQSARPDIRINHGRPAVRDALDRFITSLKKGDIYYRFSSRHPKSDWKKYLTEKYIKTDAQIKPEHFVITNTALAPTYTPKLERAVKVLGGKDPFDHNVNAYIYGDTTLFLDYNSESVLEIQNPAFAKFIKHIFKALYERL